MADKFDIYQHVTDRIVAAIESGNAGKWQMPWHVQANAKTTGMMTLPRNVSGRAYRGINIWLLLAEKLEKEYSSDLWATYNGWAAKGAQVRKGERGTLIVFWKQLTVKDETDADKPKKIFMARGYNVFNADQVDNFVPKAIPELPISERIAAAEDFFAKVPAVVEHGGNRACYSPMLDKIQLPNFEQFHSAEAYYTTRGHETVHWTKQPERCDRDFSKKHGDAAYAFEELVAELGAAFLCAKLQIANEPRPDHAAYLTNWLSVLKDDKRAIFTAASKAQKAVDFIIAATGEEAEEADAMELAA